MAAILLRVYFIMRPGAFLELVEEHAELVGRFAGDVIGESVRAQAEQELIALISKNAVWSHSTDWRLGWAERSKREGFSLFIVFTVVESGNRFGRIMQAVDTGKGRTGWREVEATARIRKERRRLIRLVKHVDDR